MATDVSNRVQEIARYRDAEESYVIQQALETGVENLWRDVIISKYLNDDLAREEAIEAVGSDMSKDAIEDDIEWALGDMGA